MIVQVARVVAVVALLGIASAIATPKGRIPLALRGVWRMMRRDCGEGAAPSSIEETPVGAWRRILAFLLVVAAAAIALF